MVLGQILYHFVKALWTGEVFPLKPQKTITDHGKVIGYLDGDESVFAGRRMALPFIVLFAGIKFWDLVGFLFVAIIVAQILAWTGVIAPPADGFTAFFWVSLGALSLSVMTESFYVLYKHRVVGLRDLLLLLNLDRVWKADTETETHQILYDETLAVKVKRGTEEFVGKISKKK